MKKQIRSIAFVLPQFHPIPENDAWWGKGFTEWTNVTKAKPLFKGHYQPHIPADLGYYDLRLHEARQAQADLAKAYGIDGFCYYHYWFNGKRLLNYPIDEMLRLGKPDMPFMLCWANENWTRRWDGLDQEILIKQDYSLKDDENHINWLCQHVFTDDRYIKVGGKPMFVVYKPFLFPNILQTVKLWRKIASTYGLDLYLCHAVFSYNKDCQKVLPGFDAVIDFEPFGIRKEDIFTYLENNRKNSKSKGMIKKLKQKIFKIDCIDAYQKFNLIDYEWMYENIKSLSQYDFKIYPSIVPGWDNSARRGLNPTLILNNSSPKKFKKWLQIIVEDFNPYSNEENFIFLNAMNEWAEGNHLEPCKTWGNQFLVKIQQVLNRE